MVQPMSYSVDEYSENINIRKLLFILLIVLFCFIGINIYISELVREYDYTIGSLSKWSILTELDAPVDVLILGDSAASQGIIPEIITEQTGLSAINIATNAQMGYYSDVVMLEDYLRRFGVPKIVILGNTFDVHVRRVVIKQMLYRNFIPSQYWTSEYYDNGLSAIELLEMALYHHFPVISRPTTVRHILTESLLSRPWNTDSRQLTPHGAYLNVNAKPYRFEHEVEIYKQKVLDQLPVTDGYREGINALIKLVSEYQVPLYVVTPPVYKEIVHTEGFSEFIEPRKQLWMEIAEQYDYIVFNPKTIEFDETLMFDANHVMDKGAEIFTLYLIENIWGTSD